MPTAQELRIPPPEMFGDLTQAGPLGPWQIAQHTEILMLPDGAILRLQTSDEQTDDGKRGTWYMSITFAGQRTPLHQQHIAWCSMIDARARALEWAKSWYDKKLEQLDERIAELSEKVEQSDELIAELADSERPTVRDDVSTLVGD